MADSVIIFDEIHLLPVKLLQPCLRGIGYINRYQNSEAILLSETMPDYKIRTEEMSSATDIIAEADENRYFYFSPGYILFTYSFDFK